MSTLASVHQRIAPSPIIDIGANLGDKAFASDLPSILLNASLGNVSHIVLTGTSIPSSRNAIKIVKEQGNNGVRLSCTAGIHPHSAKDILKFTNWKTQLSTMVNQNREVVKAIGECGLDYNRNFSPQDVQRQAFEEQLQLAQHLKLPVFLHCRDAFEDFYAILSKFPDLKKCVHCHTDPDASHLSDLLALPECYIGITGWVADDRRGADLAALVPKIPLEGLMIETDAPYLTPRNLPKPQPRRNEPALLPWVLKKVAECYGVSEDEVAQATTKNAKAFFALP